MNTKPRRVRNWNPRNAAHDSPKMHDDAPVTLWNLRAARLRLEPVGRSLTGCSLRSIAMHDRTKGGSRTDDTRA